MVWSALIVRHPRDPRCITRIGPRTEGEPGGYWRYRKAVALLGVAIDHDESGRS